MKRKNPSYKYQCDNKIKIYSESPFNKSQYYRILNNAKSRTKGEYIISEETLKYLGELFKFINNLILSKNDMELFKFILILSMTYFYKSKDGIQIYLFSTEFQEINGRL